MERSESAMGLRAMMDGEDEALKQLGALRPISDERSSSVTLTKRISVYNLGSYTKRLTTPLYRKQAMNSYALLAAENSFDAADCLGVLCSSLRCAPMGYVTRVCGGHRFCLPVYAKELVSGTFYRIAGYMVTEKGFVAVAKRRWLLWVLLGMLCGVTFSLSYLLFAYGTAGAWEQLNYLWQQFLALW